MSGLLIKQMSNPEPIAKARGVADQWAQSSEVRAASFRHMVNEGMSISSMLVHNRMIDDRTAKMQELAGELPPYAQNYPIRDNVKLYRQWMKNGDIGTADDGALVPLTARGEMLLNNSKFNEEMRSMVFADSMVKQHPDQVMSDDWIAENGTADLAARRKKNLDIMSRGTATQQFLGTGAAAFLDPLILATLPFGISTAGAKVSIATIAGRTAMRESMLAFASESAIQAQVFHFKQGIGSPYTFKDAAFNTLAATVGAGLLAPTIASSIQLVKRYRSRVKAGTIEPTPEAHQAAEVLEDLQRAEETRTPDMDPQIHAERVNEAARLGNDGELLEVADPEITKIPEAVDQVQRSVDEFAEGQPSALVDESTAIVARTVDGDVHKINFQASRDFATGNATDDIAESMLVKGNKKVELQAMAESNGLPKSGTKAQIAERLKRFADESTPLNPKAEAELIAEAKLQDLPYEPELSLSPADRAIEQRLMRKIIDTPDEELDAIYKTLDDTNDGHVLSVDAAREFSPDYLANRTKAPAVQEPASAYIKREMTRRLAAAKARGQKFHVLFTAGGTGSGKTTGLKLSPIEANGSDFILDSNLSSLGSAAKKMNEVLEAGGDVFVHYTFRDPIEALENGAFKRAMRQFGENGTGRTVPINIHVATHVKSNRVVKELMEAFKDNDRVEFLFVDNTNGKGKAKLTTVDKLPDLDENKLLAEAEAARVKALKDGKINEQVADGFKATARASAEDGTGVSRLAEPGGDGRARGADSEGPRGPPQEAQEVTPTAARVKQAVAAAGDDTLDDLDELVDAARARLAESDVTIEVGTPDAPREISARQFFDELDDGEKALADVELCVRGSGVA